MLCIILLDGARADAFDAGFAAGTLPALARLRDEGGRHTVTTVFPSVTGPAYAPFLTGRFPGPVGLPGLRWFDRARTRCRVPPYCRSYVGSEMRHLDGDLDPAVPTLFELAPSRFQAMSMLGRGARRGEQVGRGPRFLLRLARTHWSGATRAWLDVDRIAGAIARRRVARDRPAVCFVALLGLDKMSHAAGHASPEAHDAIAQADALVAALRDDAERAGVWDETRLWVVSDHGHSPVRAHDDLAGAVADAGWRVTAHPWVWRRRPDVAVMVSGNAMANLYVDLDRRDRPWWPSLRARWEPLAELLLARESVDLVILPHGPARCEVRTARRGGAFIERADGRYAYRPVTGDPLGLGGALEGLDAGDAHDVTARGEYPDSIVQIAHLAGSARAGDVIVSAAREWDLRARWEPIAHVSTHGALHPEHMLVPLLLSHPPSRAPRRTVDVMPAALRVLGIQSAAQPLDGQPF